VRIGVTSPFPLLLWGIALAVVRHLAAPDAPLYRELPRRARAWIRDPALGTAMTAVVGTRPAIYLVGYLALFMFGYAEGRAPVPPSDNALLPLPVRWDAGWYLQIVTDGYQYSPDRPDLQQNIVFFPAYPLLMRGIGRLLGGHMAGYVAAGTVI